ncbi:MAG: penicillin-binding protein 2, partial [Clostridiales bacterium]|nr:penicillin-binding protein 2 [Clostridiales bacterium]
MSKRIFGFLKNRYVYLSVLFVAAIFTIIWQLFQLQIVNGQNNVDQAKNGIEKVWSVEAPRGNIYDRNGTLIATNRTAYTVKMVYVNLSVDDRNKMYLDLMNLFEKNGDVYVNDLGKNLQYPIDWGKNTADGNEDKRSKWFSDTLKIKQKSIIKQFVTPQDVFNYMRKDLFNISDSYSDEDAYKIMVIRYEAFING